MKLLCLLILSWLTLGCVYAQTEVLPLPISPPKAAECTDRIVTLSGQDFYCRIDKLQGNFLYFSQLPYQTNRPGFISVDSVAALFPGSRQTVKIIRGNAGLMSRVSAPDLARAEQTPRNANAVIELSGGVLASIPLYATTAFDAPVAQWLQNFAAVGTEYGGRLVIQPSNRRVGGYFSFHSRYNSGSADSIHGYESQKTICLGFTFQEKLNEDIQVKLRVGGAYMTRKQLLEGSWNRPGLTTGTPMVGPLRSFDQELSGLGIDLGASVLGCLAGPVYVGMDLGLQLVEGTGDPGTYRYKGLTGSRTITQSSPDKASLSRFRAGIFLSVRI